ncbi:MAG: hypothetical protein FJ090_04575 [Deltaproteobacteria bacterium]|nr:hypothetical protein [Deltaproteobacteria bacterium]
MALGGGLLLVAGLAASAAGAEPIRLATSSTAVVEVLPARHGRVDVLVHDNTEDLRAQLRTLRNAAVRDARAVDTGGDWVLSFFMLDEAMTFELAGAPGNLVLVPVPTARPDTILAPSDASAALAQAPEPPACRPDEVALAPLPTGQTRWADAALASAPRVPVWNAAEVSGASWAMVSETRNALARNGAPRGELLYRLGALHRELGHAREAAWYFGEAATAPDVAAPDVAAALMQRSRALLAVGANAPASDAARLAAHSGAPPEMVLHLVTLAAWRGREDAAPGLGWALAGSATTVESRVLAAVVIGGSGCTAEALELLRPVVKLGSPDLLDERLLFLSDLLYRHGEFLASSSVLGEVATGGLDPELRAVHAQRGGLGAIAAQPPTAWTAYVPDMRRDAALPGAAGADALHLLAQVYLATGEERDAIGAWAELVRRDEALVRGEAGSRLARSWVKRSALLLAAGDGDEAMALHCGAWHDGLVAHLDDLSPIAAVAEQYASGGFLDRALAAWKTVATTEEARGLDSSLAVHHLARLYVATGASGDALDSVRWLRQRPYGRTHSVELDVLERAARGEAPGQVTAATGCAGVDLERSSVCAALARDTEAQAAIESVLAKKRLASR